MGHGGANAPGMGHGAGKGPGMAQGLANGLQGFAAAVARGLGIGHGDANAPGVAHGGGKGQAIGHGDANAPGVAHGGGKGQGIGHGGANAPGGAHGGGTGAARGGGFGFGHASLGNPTLGSHSQNTSHKGETHDGRSFSNHAQDHTDPSKKADQVEQVDDRGPGKEKGLVDSLPGQEQQADRGTTLNPVTIHSDPDNIVTLGPSPDQELQPDRGLTLNLETIHSDLDDIVTRGLKSGQDLQADPGGALNPSAIHSDPGNIVTLGFPSSQELQADRGRALTPETVYSDPDDIVTRGLPPSLELNLSRGKSLPVSWLAKIAPINIVPDTDETPAIVPRHLWELDDDHAKLLPSTEPEQEDEDDANAGWKLVLYFAPVLFLFSWIVQGVLDARKRKAASLQFEPNAFPSIGSVNGEEQCKPYGARPVLDKLAAALSIAGEPQQKAADEKKGALLERFSGDPDVEKARAEIEHAQEIDETFRKDFDGIGLG